MQTQTTVMVWGCSRANGIGDWNMCEGTIEMEACIGILQTLYCHQDDVFHGKSIKIMPALILHVLQQRGFVDTD